MKLNAPIFALKRHAKTIARVEGIRLHQALDRVARENGFNSWSHLASAHAEQGPASRILASLSPGDLILLGARPGQGKTLLGLELSMLAGTIDRQGLFFSLDYTEADIDERLAALSPGSKMKADAPLIDISDDICAGYIIARLGARAGKALIVIDYLQLLDQRRSHPELAEQVEQLKAFAKRSGAIIVLISQIDRAFEKSGKALPDLSDVRLPNPLDLNLFDRACFLHHGEVRMSKAA